MASSRGDTSRLLACSTFFVCSLLNYSYVLGEGKEKTRRQDKRISNAVNSDSTMKKTMKHMRHNARIMIRIFLCNLKLMLRKMRENKFQGIGKLWT